MRRSDRRRLRCGGVLNIAASGSATGTVALGFLGTFHLPSTVSFTAPAWSGGASTLSIDATLTLNGNVRRQLVTRRHRATLRSTPGLLRLDLAGFASTSSTTPPRALLRPFAGLAEQDPSSPSAAPTSVISQRRHADNDIDHLTRVADAAHLYVDPKSTKEAGAHITDADPVASGSQSATIGTTAFASVNDAIAAAVAASTSRADSIANYTVIVNGGTYAEDVVVSAGLGLVLQSGPVTFNSLSSTVSTAALDLNGVALTTGSSSDATFTSGIFGTGSLTKVGTGAFALSGANGYTGGTTLSAGTLDVNSSTAIGAGPLVIAAGTKLGNTGQARPVARHDRDRQRRRSWNGDFTFVGLESARSRNRHLSP